MNRGPYRHLSARPVIALPSAFSGDQPRSAQSGLKSAQISQLGTEIPNVFNVCVGLLVNSKPFQPEEVAGEMSFRSLRRQ
jgi:hypothetical protein